MICATESSSSCILGIWYLFFLDLSIHRLCVEGFFDRAIFLCCTMKSSFVNLPCFSIYSSLIRFLISPSTRSWMWIGSFPPFTCLGIRRILKWVKFCCFSNDPVDWRHDHYDFQRSDVGSCVVSFRRCIASAFNFVVTTPNWSCRSCPRRFLVLFSETTNVASWNFFHSDEIGMIKDPNRYSKRTLILIHLCSYNRVSCDITEMKRRTHRHQ